jgi:hypothetical protein
MASLVHSVRFARAIDVSQISSYPDGAGIADTGHLHLLFLAGPWGALPLRVAGPARLLCLSATAPVVPALAAEGT